jgi:cbb3-type cytochrome oxidase subunit 3
MGDCDAILRPFLQQCAREGNEFPALFFERSHCQGSRVTPLDLNRIGSMYVPPHASVVLTSTEGSHANFPGPSVVVSTDAYFTLWGNADGSACAENHPHCGRKISFDGGLETQLKNISVRNHKPWDLYVHDVASSTGGSLKYKHHNLTMNTDAFFNRVCASSSASVYNCQCVDGYNKMILEHPELSSEMSYVNNLEDSCDPVKHYYPSGAKIGTFSEEECVKMLFNMVSSGSVLPKDRGGPEHFRCGNRSFENVFATSGETLETRAYDDEQDKQLERLEMPSYDLPPVCAYILAIILFFFLLFLYLYVLDLLHRKKKNQQDEGQKQLFVLNKKT